MERQDLFVHMYEDQRTSLSYRRQRENEVFVWGSTILLGFIGAALFVAREDGAALLQTWTGAVLAALALAAVTLFSVAWQLKQRKHVAAHQRMLVEIQTELGCFHGHTVSFPAEWSKWGTGHTTFAERVSGPSKVTATFVLGAFAILAALVSPVILS